MDTTTELDDEFEVLLESIATVELMTVAFILVSLVGGIIVVTFPVYPFNDVLVILLYPVVIGVFGKITFAVD